MRAPKPFRTSFSLLIALSLLGAAFLFLGCEGDEGPMGPSGDPGTAACFTCHTDEDTQLIVARALQWENSLHATGGTYERNFLPCASCHTSEGFVSLLNTGRAVAPSNPSPVGCFTCHAPHTQGDFSLRTTAPVTFALPGGVYDYEASNLCANCHQARRPNPMIAAAPDSTTITSTRWGPHHSTQGNMLAGRGGYQYGGFNYNNSYHQVGVKDGCIACHMAAPFGSQAGGHQMGLVYLSDGEETDLVAGCNITGCHGADPLEDFNPAADGDHDGDGTVKGVQDEVEGLLALLRGELLARGFITDEDLPNASSDFPLKLSAAEVGALFNFLYVLEDQSLGIHNTNYAVGLLKSALDNLPVE